MRLHQLEKKKQETMNLRKREKDRFREENKRGNDIVIL